MASDVVELEVFIASPSDVLAERKAIFALESELNDTFGSKGIRVRSTGWETTPPDFGRPQEHINPMVERCDMFIGVLSRRWGTPTGGFTSGFEEEFESAVARRTNDGTNPKICLFFADVPKAVVDEGAPGLLQVMEFRQKIMDQQSAMFRQFESTDSLARKVQMVVVRELLARSSGQRDSGPKGTTDAGPSEPAQAPTPTAVADGGASAEEGSTQLATVLEDILAVVRGNMPQKPIDWDRFTLVGLAANQDGDFLQAHLANRLYKRRGDLDLVQAEYGCWLNTLLFDVGSSLSLHQRTIPGWAVIGPIRESLETLLMDAARSSDTSVARGATRTMLRLGIHPSELWRKFDDAEPMGERPLPPVIWVEVLNAEPGRGDALDYFLEPFASAAGVGPDSDEVTRLIRAILEVRVEDHGEDLNEATRDILESVRDALDGAPDQLARLVESGTHASQLNAVLEARLSNLSPAGLNGLAAQKSNKAARLAAVRHGLEAGTLSDATVRVLFADGNAEVTTALMTDARSDRQRAAGYLAILNENKELKAKSWHKAELTALLTDEDTLRGYDRVSALSNLAWEALTYRVPAAMLDEARDVLDTEAAASRAAWLEQLDGNEKVADFLANERCRIAADLLTRSAALTGADVERVLSFIERQPFLSQELWTMLDRLGSSSQHLPRIAQTLRAAGDDLGFMYAINSLDGPLGPAVADALMASELDSMASSAKKWWAGQPERTTEELHEALYDDDTALRIAALDSLKTRQTIEELTALLYAYPNAGRAYWYNVIVGLDEFIYARPAETLASDDSTQT
ncbi:MAG: hypothetical protein JWP74_531 [Marmoricola sp.]|nr:hypothetical protein [Marmoricola sp.]